MFLKCRQPWASVKIAWGYYEWQKLEIFLLKLEKINNVALSECSFLIASGDCAFRVQQPTDSFCSSAAAPFPANSYISCQKGNIEKLREIQSEIDFG